VETNSTPAPAPVQVPPVTDTVQPTPNSPQPVANAPEGGEKKTMMYMILGVIAILLIVGGIYLFLSRKQASEKTINNTSSTTVQQDTTSTDTLIKDANAVDVTSPDSDFKTVDTDLGSL